MLPPNRPRKAVQGLHQVSYSDAGAQRKSRPDDDLLRSSPCGVSQSNAIQAKDTSRDCLVLHGHWRAFLSVVKMNCTRLRLPSGNGLGDDMSGVLSGIVCFMRVLLVPDSRKSASRKQSRTV